MRTLFIIMLLLVGLAAMAQKPAKPVLPDNKVHLSLQTRFVGKEVRLRWAPSRAGSWVHLNRIGYVLERSEISEANKKNAWIRVSPLVIKPEPLDQWKRFAVNPINKHALVIAQAIYGKRFNTTSNADLSDRADELSNRYSFALLAADLSFVAAQAAGLGFTDKTIEPGKHYAYRLMAAGKLVNYAPVDTAIALANTSQVEPLSRPAWQTPNEGERQVELLWDKTMHSRLFTAYYIERSADGKTYQPLTKEPYINMESDVANKSSFVYTDSLPANYKPYSYRLIGITEFGELSPPSEIVRAMGRDRTPPPAPVNLKTKALGGRRVEITWDAQQTPDLKGFYIGRSKKSLDDFKPLFDKPLPPNTRRYVDEQANPDTTNYYVVAAADTANNASASMSAYVLFVDSIPPGKPTGLSATVSRAGIVRLSWSKSSETDVKGYIVLAANQRDHQFITVVKQAIPDPVFMDTLQLKTLTESIFYQVKAVDRNNNTSVVSDILEVKKPDVVPPNIPVFSQYDIKSDGVLLEWAASTSKDVVGHVLYRREVKQPVFAKLARIESKAIHSYVDKSVRPNQRYDYMIRAEDDAGLQSPDSPILPVRVPEFKTRAGVQDFAVQYNNSKKQAEISWQNPPVSDVFTVIYRAENGGAFLTLNAPPKGVMQYQDRAIKPGVKYEYTTRVFYPDGKSSPLGPVSTVSF